MSIWIPTPSTAARDYIRWTTVTAFVIGMLWLTSLFFEEYHTAVRMQNGALHEINRIQEHNQGVDARNAKLEAQPPQYKIQKRTREIEIPVIEKRTEDPVSKPNFDSPDVVAGGVPMPPPPQPAPVPRKKTVVIEETIKEPIPVEKESRIEIDAGIVKIAMSNEAHWSAIFKMVFTLLSTFFGIKLINFGFRKLEQPDAVA